jgi:hypothetical protein
LQEQLVLGVVRHGTVEKLDHTAETLQLLQQEHLVHIVAGKAIRRGHEDAFDSGGRDCVAQCIQAGTA